MKRLGFRARLFAILAMFAVIPPLLLTFAWGGTMRLVLPLMAGKAAWDTVAVTGERVIDIARRGSTAPADSALIAAHERALVNASTRSRQFELIADRAPAALVAASLILLALLTFIAARLAGHLTRQLTRPLDELLAWTERISRGEPLPDAEARGAPEFGVLRAGMRRMSGEIEAGRRAAIEAERLAAMRETARQVAHELKNPLTPIRFAVARLRGQVPAELADSVAVLDAESARLDRMARSFAQFGRLPEGPIAEVDVAELVASAVRAAVPTEMRTDVQVPTGLSLMGRYEPLERALGNVLMNAVEACGASGRLVVTATAEGAGADRRIAIVVQDDGPGIDAAKLASIWDPYVTGKAGGTGLGLAIVRQTVEAHGGTVRADSEPGRGTRITLVLPVGSQPGMEAG
ncbi:MAG TPA: HAMP domain-containing sensor histidine kinase [Gemmatimonadaceae bacterium]|nr:HAMP domain-containing sensor histidine kinase [Gemmatimonadaceae bacterium]